MIRFALLASAAAILALPQALIAQDDDETFGGAKGADLSIDAMEPDGGAVTIGRAGEYPADIARYLLASGPRAANLSPDGKTIAFAWDVTGESELWVMPASGGQPQQVTFKTGVFAPVWTPDGTRLFYSAESRTATNSPAISRSRCGSQESDSPAPQRAAISASSAIIAADGRSFINASNRARGRGLFDIYRGTLDGESE